MPKQLDTFTPQKRNANRHTQRGMGELERSVQEDGWIGAITAAADGEIFDGSARREVVETALNAEPIVIESDGTRPIIIQRTDIPTATDPRAIRLGLSANKISADNLDWDTEVLRELQEQDAALLEGLFRDDELDMLLVTVPDFEPASLGEQSRLDEKAKIQCPECGYAFTP